MRFGNQPRDSFNSWRDGSGGGREAMRHIAVLPQLRMPCVALVNPAVFRQARRCRRCL
jgi:hypothetical protein